MIGDLIKSGRDPDGGNTPPPRRRVKLYRTPVWKKPWLRQFLYITAGVIFVGALILLLVLKPHRDRALSYDLEQMRKLEKASIIYDRNHEEIGRLFLRNRQPVSLDEIPFHLVQALVATEDGRFYAHSGIDFIGIARAAMINVRQGGYSQGASTITQQLARQSFELSEKSIRRKLTEAFLARRIEQHYSKGQILEFYLNRIYFGGGYWGIEAAARGYFGKPASELTIDESATLCGLIKSPNKFSPTRNPKLSERERNYVLDRMLAEKMLSRADCARLKAIPLETKPSTASQNSNYVNETVRQQVIEQLENEKVLTGGFRIETTIDRGIQQAATESLQRHLLAIENSTPAYPHQTYERYSKMFETAEDGQIAPPVPAYLQGALIMVDNRTGAIIALAGGRDFEHNEFNRALQARRPAGTAFAPLVFAAAFEDGDKFPASTLADSPIDAQLVMIGGLTGWLGEWGTEKEDPTWEGRITAREALVKGKIAATVRMGMDVGLDKVKALAARAGIESPLRDFNATFLGASEVTLAEMAMAFTIFPNKGTRPAELQIIETIRDENGTAIYSRHQPGEEPALVEVADPVACFQVHSCLEEVITTGTGAKAQQYGLGDFPAAGKTGTHYDSTDLLFAGYNSAVTCAVWAGFDRPRTIYNGAFSSDVVLPVWVDAMNASTATFQPAAFAPPDDARVLEICNVSGLRATDRCYESVKDETGKTIRVVRCTHPEVIHDGDALERYCDVHSQGGRATDSLASLLAMATKLPKDEDSENEPVLMAAPTVVGVDPYHSVRPSVRPRIVEDEPEEEEVVAERAEVVIPTKMGSDKARIELESPPPLEIE
ncbi:hypothetical protein BH23VER1_BH23VER1_08620 [soil metagenome]